MLDVKVGDGAFMKTLDDARQLAEAMLALGEHAGREVVCLLTDMDQPLGAAVGNALEVIEALATVRGEGPPDFTELVLDACARLLALSDLGVNFGEGRTIGRARDRGRLGRGDVAPLDRGAGRHRRRVGARAGAGRARGDRAARGHGRRSLGAIAVGNAALHLGAGRQTKADEIDHAVGVVCRAKRGDAVEAGQVLAEVHARDEAAAAAAAGEVLAAYELGDAPPLGAARPARGAQPLSAASRRDPRPFRPRWASVSSCPSCPRSRRFGARSRPCSRGGGSSGCASTTCG